MPNTSDDLPVNECYDRYFQAATINSLIRIRELDECADIAAAQSVLRILRPSVPILRRFTIPDSNGSPANSVK